MQSNTNNKLNSKEADTHQNILPSTGHGFYCDSSSANKSHFNAGQNPASTGHGDPMYVDSPIPGKSHSGQPSSSSGSIAGFTGQGGSSYTAQPDLSVPFNAGLNPCSFSHSGGSAANVPSTNQSSESADKSLAHNDQIHTDSHSSSAHSGSSHTGITPVAQNPLHTGLVGFGPKKTYKEKEFEHHDPMHIDSHPGSSSHTASHTSSSSHTADSSHTGITPVSQNPLHTGLIGFPKSKAKELGIIGASQDKELHGASQEKSLHADKDLHGKEGHNDGKEGHKESASSDKDLHGKEGHKEGHKESASLDKGHDGKEGHKESASLDKDLHGKEGHKEGHKESASDKGHISKEGHKEGHKESASSSSSGKELHGASQEKSHAKEGHKDAAAKEGHKQVSGAHKDKPLNEKEGHKDKPLHEKPMQKEAPKDDFQLSDEDIHKMASNLDKKEQSTTKKELHEAKQLEYREERKQAASVAKSSDASIMEKTKAAGTILAAGVKELKEASMKKVAARKSDKASDKVYHP